MSSLKKLFSDTMIYGVSSIVGRFLNYLLVPLYTYKIAATSGGYGVVTEIYAYTALLLVILTFGMETTFFYFANKYREKADKVFATALTAVGGVSALFLLLLFSFIKPIAHGLGYDSHPEFLTIMGCVVALDAFQAILYALLRFEGRPLKFAFLKLLFIFCNIGLNLFVFVLAPGLQAKYPQLMGWYDPNWQVGYVERGNTAIMVDYIKELADVDVFEIVPVVAYPAVYDECTAYVTEEINENRRPAYKDDITNLADYETIFIGGPIWWGRPPMLFRTFFEKHPELDGKTIIPFGTHGGSGVGSYATLIKEYYPNATVLESLGISGSSIRNESSKQTVGDWLKKLGVDKQSTGIRNVRTSAADNGVSYSLNGIRSSNQRGIQIRNGQKYISR